MTVRLETKIHRYIGTSTDVKPYPGQVNPDGHTVTEQELPPGSTFMAADTLEIWRWNGREWVFGDSPEVHELKEIKGLLGAILDQMNGAL